jgi:D-lyxose ketol-isomerase
LIEYIGEEMNEFAELICNYLNERTTPMALMLELEDVLDKDTETFVVSLWKNIIFEALKLQKLKELTNSSD